MKLGYIDYLNCYPFYFRMFEKQAVNGIRIYPGHGGDVEYPDGFPFPDLVLFVPDVGMAVYRGRAFQARVERQAAGVVFVPVADCDSGQVVETYAHPPGVLQEDVRGARVHEPAVAVTQFDKNRDAVFRQVLVRRDGVVDEYRQSYPGGIGSHHGPCLVYGEDTRCREGKEFFS